MVCLRGELAGDTSDIVFRYQPLEVQRLRKLGEPVNILCDDDEAIMDELVTFEAAEDECTIPPLPPQQRLPAMPCDDDDEDWFEDI